MNIVPLSARTSHEQLCKPSWEAIAPCLHVWEPPFQPPPGPTCSLRSPGSTTPIPSSPPPDPIAASQSTPPSADSPPHCGKPKAITPAEQSPIPGPRSPAPSRGSDPAVSAVSSDSGACLSSRQQARPPQPAQARHRRSTSPPPATDPPRRLPYATSNLRNCPEKPSPAHRRS